MKINLSPLGDRLIVKPVSANKMAKSGIVLPDTVDKEKPEEGEVIAVGPGRILDNGERLEMSVKVGNKVLFKKYAPDEFKIEGEEYLFLSESDIIAIIN